MNTVFLGEVAQVDRTAASDAECSQLPYVGLEHIEKDRGHLVQGYSPQPETLLATKFLFSSRHVLYCKLRPYLNKVVLPDFDGVCTTEILPILPDGKRLDRGFLFVLLSPDFVAWASHHVSGANLPRLAPETLLEYRFSLPTLAEQQRIVRTLEKADRLRRMRCNALDLSDTLISAAFLELFADPIRNPKGWNVGLLEDVCSLVRGGSPRPQGDPRFFGGPVPRLMIADITRDGTYVTPLIDSLTLDGAGKSRPMSAGSVVMAVSGAVGLPAILQCDACIHDGFVGFRNLDAKLMPVYFYYFLSMLRATNRLQATGAIWKNLSTDQINEWKVVIPPIALQQQFCEIAGRVRRLRGQQTEAARQAEHLFETLLHQSFSSVINPISVSL